DPAGIGPEVVLKALASPGRPEAEYVVYGPAAALDERAARFGLRPVSDLGVSVVDVGLDGAIRPGEVSAVSGHAAARAVIAAARDALRGDLAGLVTAPLHKEALAAAGYSWPGHTELLAEIAGAPDVAMLFVGG